MKHRKGDPVNGWLVIDKPEGMGSTEVVNLTRRLLNAQKNGHTGTLDPFASGILPIAFGETTKLIDFLGDETKEYEFTVQWGTETDSADSDGSITADNGRIPADEEILAVLPQFCGEITQTPPAFCAVKINGRRAYELARKGEEVNIPERQITVYELEFTGSLPGGRSSFKVRCSKGTYVRSLGRDIARRLGTFGHLCRLRRTRSGIFDESAKILLETLQNVVYVDERKRFLLPSETSLRDIAVMAVSEAEAAKLLHGQALSPKSREHSFSVGQTVPAVCEGRLAAMLRIEETRFSPVRVFNFNQEKKEK